MAFSGHTEFLAQRTGADVVMMLVGATASGPLRVALVTTHLPLSAVPASITRELLTRTVRIVADELSAKFRIDKPHRRLWRCASKALTPPDRFPLTRSSFRPKRANSIA